MNTTGLHFYFQIPYSLLSSGGNVLSVAFEKTEIGLQKNAVESAV